MNRRFILKTTFVVLAALFTISMYLIFTASHEGTIATIFVDGECIKSIDLSKVKEEDSIAVKVKDDSVIIAIKPYDICIRKSNCPDQICVNQGWITESKLPVVCLPNRIVIQLEKNVENGGFDSVSQ